MPLSNTFRLFALTIVLSVIDTPANSYTISRVGESTDSVDILDHAESLQSEVRDKFKRENNIGIAKDRLITAESVVKDYVNTAPLTTGDDRLSENSFDILKEIEVTTGKISSIKLSQNNDTTVPKNASVSNNIGKNDDLQTKTENKIEKTTESEAILTNDKVDHRKYEKYGLISEKLSTTETNPSWKKYTNIIRKPTSETDDGVALPSKISEVMITDETGNPTQDSKAGDIPSLNQIKNFLSFFKSDVQNDTKSSKEVTEQSKDKQGSSATDKESPATVESKRGGFLDFSLKSLFEDNDDKKDNSQETTSRPKSRKLSWRFGSRYRAKEDNSAERQGKNRFRFRNDDDKKKEKTDKSAIKESQEERKQTGESKEEGYGKSIEQYQNKEKTDDSKTGHKPNKDINAIQEDVVSKSYVISNPESKSEKQILKEWTDFDNKQEQNKNKNNEDLEKLNLQHINLQKDQVKDKDNKSFKSRESGEVNKDDVNIWKVDPKDTQINIQSKKNMYNNKSGEIKTDNYDKSRDEDYRSQLKYEQDNTRDRLNKEAKRPDNENKDDKRSRSRYDTNSRENSDHERRNNENRDDRNRNRSRNEDKSRERSDNDRRNQNNQNRDDGNRYRSRNEDKSRERSDNERRKQNNENKDDSYRNRSRNGENSRERFDSEGKKQNNQNRDYGNRYRSRNEETSGERSDNERRKQNNENRDDISRNRSRNEENSRERYNNERRKPTNENKDDTNRSHSRKEDISRDNRSRNNENRDDKSRSRNQDNSRERSEFDRRKQNDDNKDERHRYSSKNEEKLKEQSNYEQGVQKNYDRNEEVRSRNEENNRGRSKEHLHDQSKIKVDSDKKVLQVQYDDHPNEDKYSQNTETPIPSLKLSDINSEIQTPIKIQINEQEQSDISNQEGDKISSQIPKLDEFTKNYFLSTIDEEEENETEAPSLPLNNNSNVITLFDEKRHGILQENKKIDLDKNLYIQVKKENEVQSTFEPYTEQTPTIDYTKKFKNQPKDEKSKVFDENTVTSFVFESTTADYEDVNMPTRVKESETLIQLNEDAIKEELLKEEIMNNYEVNMGRYKEASIETTTQTTIPVKIYEVTKPVKVKDKTVTEEKLSVKPLSLLDKLKTTILYPVSPNYKPPKKIDVQPPKTFVRDPDDNSWRNESLSSLGIVFNPKNSSKPFTQVLKNKTETELNSLLDKSNKNETPDLRERLEKIAEMRKNKKKKTDAYGNVVYNDYEESYSKESFATKENEVPVSPPSVTTAGVASDVTMPTTRKPSTTTTKSINSKSTAKTPKKVFNVAEYYDSCEEDDADYLSLAKIDLKKYTPPLRNTEEVVTTPSWPITNNRMAYNKYDDRKPTIQYFPPLTTQKVVYNKEYNNDFNNKMNSYTHTAPPTNVLPVSYTRPTTPKPIQKMEQHNMFTPSFRFTPDPSLTTKPMEFSKEFFMTPVPEVSADKEQYTYVADDGSYNKASDVIKHYRDFLNAVAKDHDEDKNMGYTPFTQIPIHEVSVGEPMFTKDSPKPELPIHYDNEPDLRKDVLQRFVHNFNQNSDRFKSELPLLYNNSIIHEAGASGAGGRDVASSRTYLSKLLARPAAPDCGNTTLELAPAYELHYYVPDQEEKEEAEPKPAALPYPYRL